MLVMSQIAIHLEFLGYDVEKKDGSLRVKHPQKSNFILREVGGGILLTSIYGGNQLARDEIAHYFYCLNSLNKKAVLVRFYADNDLDFFAEAWLPNIYDKTNFGTSLEMFNRDLGLIHDEKTGDIAKFLK